MPQVEENLTPVRPARLFSPGNTLPFVLVTALFLLWGIPNNLNDILIKQFMKSFEITRVKAGLIQSAFYMGYFLLSMPAGFLMRKYGYKAGLVTGLFLYSTGTFLFWPAAHVRQFGFFLLALFVIASGLAFLETGANPFIATLGDPRTSERRLNFSLCRSVGSWPEYASGRTRKLVSCYGASVSRQPRRDILRWRQG
jgi:MFS transporter, FHS family, L-fucose permease